MDGEHALVGVDLQELLLTLHDLVVVLKVLVEEGEAVKSLKEVLAQVPNDGETLGNVAVVGAEAIRAIEDLKGLLIGEFAYHSIAQVAKERLRQIARRLFAASKALDVDHCIV